ncbi:MAG TPA: Gfo/Idh/MocA family oxidoreductase [Victivallales bacterium]|nr:Gfo/Idh/MocA family oxidoreductase [Victivallales bacterium]HPO91418.1 Gfo/Idh/MocA family oxidoreductase [Victivallales bacterium]HRR06063.1 Gfo/Idh/MocA family oxidoreductase [Victivallales bacterium]HRR29163.1 Gfo/Idh/MocA family oxidoreductase [Victivallales bacterium]HRU01506.1 Gfo/Idh/MocA family oxidoreductase [Victivallales bacterium]
MTKKIKMAVIGCGDFLRWQANEIKNSKFVEVAKFYDPRKEQAEKFAKELGGKAVDSSDEIFNDSEVKLIALFTPPWIRESQFIEAAKAGKHIITTKPLAPTVKECESIVKAQKKYNIKAAVIYSRTGDAFVETAKKILDDGKFGKLALYKQDWIHAYPKWNNWATDPKKNGGPFMDAMIHNLNTANYLMNRPVVSKTFFSENLSHPQLKCADTEAMIVKYKGGAMANLFITWAADLATYDTTGNNREHIDIFYLITDKGWRITKEWRKEGCFLIASREKIKKEIKVIPIKINIYDAFVRHIGGDLLPRILVSLKDAYSDIKMICEK